MSISSTRVVIALSGGVDSSVAAYLLKEKGYDVLGVFMKNWHDETVTISEECPWLEDSYDAMLVAQKLNIPFKVIDLSSQYKEKIVDYMFNEYESGNTPNPDVLCNREIKFDVFLETVKQLNAEFIATNLDAVTHLTDAQEWAGNGSMVGAIRGCTGMEPTVVGKPSPLMIEYLESKYGVDRKRICMVGDRLDTDVLFGTDNGLMSLLVLSGVTTEEKLLSQENSITPDYYSDDINDFFATEESSVESSV